MDSISSWLDDLRDIGALRELDDPDVLAGGGASNGKLTHTSSRTSY